MSESNKAGAAKADDPLSLLQQGRMDDALIAAQRCCEREPANPHVWYVTAGIYAQTGNMAQVVNCCRRVIELQPGNGSAHYNLAVALAQMEQLAEAVAAYDASLRINSQHHPSRTGRAGMLRRLGRLDEAETDCRQAIAADPAGAAGHLELGHVLRARGRLVEALDSYQAAARLAPRLADGCYFSGITLSALGRSRAAIEAYRQALARAPEHAEAHNNLGHELLREGAVQEAVDCFRRCAALGPHRPESHVNLGIALETTGDLRAAEASFRKAMEVDPEFLEAQLRLGFLLCDDGRHDAAWSAFEHCRRMAPDNARAAAGAATVLERKGNHEQALDLLTPYTGLERTDPDVARAYAAVSGHVGTVEDAVAYLERTLSRDDLDREVRCALSYALGDLHDRLENYDEAFGHYGRANELAPKAFDPERHSRYIDELIGTYPAAAGESQQHLVEVGQRPIFVVGMPRSGTTLVEQILASHAQVFGAGELRDMGQIAASLTEQTGLRHDTGLSTPLRTELAERYRKRTRALAGDAAAVVDKMPHNFEHLGLIAQLLPEARIVHVRRSAMDTCLSLYFHHFNAMHSYTTDLAWLGGYYRQYQRLMAHWDRVLTLPMLTVDYEALVQEPVASIERLLAFCGLPWDRRCLDFHTSGRVVTTPSYDQVRRPLYTSSIGRWRNYGKHLGALRAALGPAAAGDSGSERTP